MSYGAITVRRLLFLIALLPVSLFADLPPFFARFSADRTGIYAGEPFQLTLTVYVSDGNLDKPISISGLPQPDRLRLDPFQQLATENVSLEGHPYEARQFRARARGLVAGSLVLAPTIQGTLIETVRNYFFVQRHQRPMGIPVESLTLTLQPVPEAGRPAGFSGAVGTFAFRATATPLDLAVGDLVTVTLQIQGDPLPEGFVPPAVTDAPGLKTYEVKPVPEESTDTQQVFRQTVVPTESFVQAIPQVAFTYFDARAGGYRTLTGGPFPLTFHAERAPVQHLYTSTQRLGTVSTPTGAPPVVTAPSETGWSGRVGQRVLAHHGSVAGGTNDITVRLAPSESAQMLFMLKPGTALTPEAPMEGWVRISCADGIGWIPETAVESRE